MAMPAPTPLEASNLAKLGATLIEFEKESGLTLSEAQKNRIADEVLRYPRYFEWHAACSTEAKERLKDFPAGIAEASEALGRMQPAERLALLHDAGTALAMFVDDLPSEDTKGNDLPSTLSDAVANIKAKAEARLRALWRPRDAGKPADMHNYMLFWALQRIFEEGGTQASIDGGATSSYARFLAAIHAALPQDIRPQPVETFLNAARRALGYRKLKGDWTTSMSPSAVARRRRIRRDQQKKHDKEKAKRAGGKDGFRWG